MRPRDQAKSPWRRRPASERSEAFGPCLCFSGQETQAEIGDVPVNGPIRVVERQGPLVILHGPGERLLPDQSGLHFGPQVRRANEITREHASDRRQIVKARSPSVNL